MCVCCCTRIHARPTSRRFDKWGPGLQPWCDLWRRAMLPESISKYSCSGRHLFSVVFITIRYEGITLWLENIFDSISVRVSVTRFQSPSLFCAAVGRAARVSNEGSAAAGRDYASFCDSDLQGFLQASINMSFMKRRAAFNMIHTTSL